MNSKEKTLFITLGSGILVRNLLNLPNSVLSLLRPHFAKIVLLVPENASAQMKEDFEQVNVVVEAVKIIEDNERAWYENLFTFVCDYLILTPGMRMFAFKAAMRSTAPVGGGRRYLYPIKLLIWQTLGRFPWVRRVLAPKLDELIFRKRPYKELFDRYKPDVVFATNIHQPLERDLVREARRQGVPNIGMPGSWDHLPKRYEPLHADTLLVWNEPIKEEAVELQQYVPEHVVVTGVPQFDIYNNTSLLLSREEFFKKFNFDPSRKLILFVSNSSYAPQDGDIVESILKEMEQGLPGKPQLLVRPFPAQDLEHEKYDKFDDREDMFVDWIRANEAFSTREPWYPSLADAVHFMNTIYHADLIVDTYTSVPLEASAFLTPGITIGYDGKRTDIPFAYSVRRFKNISHYQHIFSIPGTVLVESDEALHEQLVRFLTNKNANIDNVTKLRDKMCYMLDGNSSKRVADVIISATK